MEIFTCQGVLFTSDRVTSKAAGQSPRSANNYSATSSMLSNDGRDYQPVGQNTLNTVEKFIDFFRLICLQDISFFNENQYTVACAVISSARMHAKVAPVWAPELAQLSGLQHHHFLNIEQKILDAFEAAVPSTSQLSQSTFSNPL